MCKLVVKANVYLPMLVNMWMNMFIGDKCVDLCKGVRRNKNRYAYVGVYYHMGVDKDAYTKVYERKCIQITMRNY